MSTPQTRLSAPERVPGGRPLRPGRIAVGFSHNDQKDLLRMALGDAGLGGVPLSTATKLLGLGPAVERRAALSEIEQRHAEAAGRLHDVHREAHDLARAGWLVAASPGLSRSLAAEWRA